MEGSGHLFTNLRSNVRAGILLYTMVLALIFSLFLQFYLQEQVETQKHLLTEKDRLTAELMVSLAKQEKLGQSGEIQFSQGFLTYQRLTGSSVSTNNAVSTDSEIQDSFEIHLSDGKVFQME
ncbi:MAG: competence protein ComGG [Streptococcaceae bacterium]|nr:competence protein ComGG [Streptococcaceae bacterium]